MARTTAYTGAWKARAQTQYYDPASPRVETVNPAHTGNDDIPDLKKVDYAAPPMQDPGMVPGGQYPGMEWVVNTGGIVLDQTPEDHTPPAYGAGNPHTVDFGGTLVTARGDAQVGYPGQLDEAVYMEGLGQVEVNPVAIQRGLNSLDQNNPGGFRRGITDWWRTNRPSRLIDRQHYSRPVWTNTADVVTNTPPASGAWSNTSSPFDSLGRNITNLWMRPQTRREPAGISEGITGDGAAAVLTQTPVSNWVVG